MFGFKLRSWMENHIVRPRKKNSKGSKNAILCTSGTTTHTIGERFVYEATTKKGKSVGVPTVPNSGCSQSHHGGATVASGGCGTVISVSSPARRREVSPIQNHAQSRYGWQSPSDKETITSPKLDNVVLYVPQETARIKTRGNLNKDSVHLEQQSSIKFQHSQQQPQQAIDCSSSSISSLSWSTGSKEQNAVRNAASVNDDVVHYEEICTILRNPANPHVIRNYGEFERPKSEQLSSFVPASVLNERRKGANMDQSKDDASTRYGKLLPSRRMQNSTGSMDQFDAPRNGRSAECLPHDSSKANLYNQASATFAPMGRAVAPLAYPPPIRGRFTNACPQQAQRGNTTTLYSSVSSPESAYSSYSDGTSPGAAANSGSIVGGGYYTPPEYYINMRTGVHYFPKSANPLTMEAHRYKISLNKIEEMSPIDPLPKTNFGNTLTGQLQYREANQAPTILCSSSPVLLSAIPVPATRGFESPSPRQRCRIRTNPWYSTNETAPAPIQSQPMSLIASSFKREKLDADAASGSSRRSKKPSNYFEHATVDGGSKSKIDKHKCNQYSSSDEGSSSSLTVEDLKMTPNTVRRKHYYPDLAERQLSHIDQQQQQQVKEQSTPSGWVAVDGSDDDVTLNEMMGKFDESYVYEKETDILSDSDLTDCQSDMDTGQDAGDECDCDTDDVDIDFIDTSAAALEGQDPLPQWASSSSHRSADYSNVRARHSGAQQRRRRFLKTRKKCVETRSPLRKSRESRSVGGTPVCLRKKNASENIRIYKTSPLSNRSSSLVFTDNIRSDRFVAIAESEKALAKADLEADIKYRQLIMEAESILVSMKSSMQSIPRDTPVASPRRLNPLANKRVEMLKNGEVAEPKRDAPKYQQATPNHMEQELAAAIHRRIELLKHETTSAPNSPNMSRLSPRKTHLTNFINQNIPPEIPPRKSALSECSKSPQLPRHHSSQVKCSPTQQRRHSPHAKCHKIDMIDTDSEPERHMTPRQSSKAIVHKALCEKRMNAINHNSSSLSKLAPHSFNVQGCEVAAYCPQSEPLKRKIYAGRNSFERIKLSFDLESGKCKCNHKKHLILNTIADLKKNLEEQSVALIGLNED